MTDPDFSGLTPPNTQPDAQPNAHPQAQVSPQNQATTTSQGPDFSGLQVVDPEQLHQHLLDAKYGGPLNAYAAYMEQVLSGGTLGLSKVAETHLLGVKPEDIAGREEAHPLLAPLGNLIGTGATLTATGGLGAVADASSVAGKLGIASLEGAGIGGINQATDDWSQNKALDAQKIGASAGLGALFGIGGTGLVEGGSALLKGIFRGAKAELPPTVTEAGVPSTGGLYHPDSIAGGGDGYAGSAPTPVVDAPIPKTGVQPTTLDDIKASVARARASGDAVELPQRAALADAISKVPLENPVNPLQLDSLASQDARDTYKAAKEEPGELGQSLTGYEALQKRELVGKTLQTIQDIAPGAKLTADAAKAGQATIDAFTNQYQAEKKALTPLFEAFKTQATGANVDHLPGMVKALSDAVPGVANMFDTEAGDFSIKPYKSSWGIDKSTYNAVKEAVEALRENPDTVQKLLNIRNGFKQHVNILDQGAGPGQVRALGKAALDYIQKEAENPEIRDALKRYAINEQQRGVIEKNFGASVGNPEYGSISKVKPESVGDKIFGNTSTVAAAKTILPKEAFNQALGNWLSEAFAKVTTDGAVSSKGFGRFLKTNEDALRVAFADNPAGLERLHALTTIMRILPDSQSINPSGTAKTLFRMIGDAKLHDLTWEGMLLKIPQTGLKKLQSQAMIRDVNQRLAGQAARNQATRILQERVARTADSISKGTKAIFQGAASQARKAE